MNVDLGSTKEVKWVDGQNNYDLDKLVLDGVTIWQKMFEVTGTATYDPITRIVTYQISGDIATLTSWSYEAIRQDSYANYLSVNGDLQSYYDDSNNTWDYDQNGVAEPVQSKTAEEFAKSHWDLSGRGEGRAGMITSGVVVNDITSGPAEVNGTIVFSNVLDETDDGTWDVAFKGYEGDTLRGEVTTTATVATPFVEITSVEELTSAPTIAVGDMVGLIAAINQQERNDDEDEEDWTRGVLFENFDTVSQLHLFDFNKTSGSITHVNHPTAIWYSSKDTSFGYPSNQNYEITATMGGATYKIRFRSILNSAVPSGISAQDLGGGYGLVTSSTDDFYHRFIDAQYMQVWGGASDAGFSSGTINSILIEAYIHSIS